MSHFLYYPSSTCSLNDIAKKACKSSADIENYSQTLLAANGRINSLDNLQQKHRPLILPGSSNAPSIHIPNCTPQEHETLAALSKSITGVGVVAISELLANTKILDHIGNTGTFMSGASAGAIKTSNYILSSIAKYEKELKIYEDFENHGGVKATLNRYEPKVKAAFNEMNEALNKKGQHILHKHAFKMRQTTNLNGRIVNESIPISNSAEVKNLKRFAKTARYVGKRLIVLDAGLRVNSVYQAARTNQDWVREAVVQTSGFAAGLTAAGVVITMIAVSSPFGLVLAIGFSGAAAFGIDVAVKQFSGEIYDRLLK